MSEPDLNVTREASTLRLRVDAGDAVGAEQACTDHIHAAAAIALAVLSDLEQKSKTETVHGRKASID